MKETLKEFLYYQIEIIMYFLLYIELKYVFTGNITISNGTYFCIATFPLIINIIQWIRKKQS